jgi:phosphoenolpyruvate carboxykinase (GTP)
LNLLSEYLDKENLEKLKALKNPNVEKQILKYLQLCRPAKTTVITDKQEDIDYVRQKALENGEEHKLATRDHTVHWDGYDDQGRDKENTRVLITREMRMSNVSSGSSLWVLSIVISLSVHYNSRTAPMWLTAKTYSTGKDTNSSRN